MLTRCHSCARTFEIDAEPDETFEQYGRPYTEISQRCTCPACGRRHEAGYAMEVVEDCIVRLRRGGVRGGAEVSAFFILPDAEAGDAKDKLFIRTGGGVREITAEQVETLINIAAALDRVDLQRMRHPDGGFMIGETTARRLIALLSAIRAGGTS